MRRFLNRKSVAMGLVVLAAFALGAAQGNRVFDGSLTIINGDGKPVTNFEQSGDAKVGKNLTVGGELTVSGPLRLKSKSVVVDGGELTFEMGGQPVAKLLRPAPGCSQLELLDDKGLPVLRAGYDTGTKRSFLVLRVDNKDVCTLAATPGAGLGGAPGGGISLENGEGVALITITNGKTWGLDNPSVIFRDTDVKDTIKVHLGNLKTVIK